MPDEENRDKNTIDVSSPLPEYLDVDILSENLISHLVPLDNENDQSIKSLDETDRNFVS